MGVTVLTKPHRLPAIWEKEHFQRVQYYRKWENRRFNW